MIRMMMRKTLLITAVIVLVGVLLAAASEPEHLKPGKHEKCPVCGMFVYKYPDWTAQITFSDHSQFYFDGVKDLFKYYFNLAKYNPGKTVADIAVVRVTEYYDTAAIDGQSAFYVIGSDVYGPMGRELIPFASREAAEEFKKDHAGTGILTFGQINMSVIARLD